ncbi:MAG: NAD(P)-binding protein [Gemmatimonadetes bacterium]|jgi:protoporphyrinogen oxidase|nr:NAD(P)-binding protein [Gemmatimonadota bacterium]MBT6626247.1 NAD(P)-binding protein [Gemmatimonadota bacterium]MBT7597950.1 NAD(P)-binding protein [Gemmatimonadota bacterium]
MTKRIVIIGGGPTGLGAAWRCVERGHENWVLLEAADTLGGLASSVVDDNGFTWDLGGHVLFSHYEYFDSLMDDLLADTWNQHVREAWVWMRERFIPYPFQNNLWRLPDDEVAACVDGLLETLLEPATEEPANFEEWIFNSFGRGVAEVFMIPYNSKVWAYPPARLSKTWMGDRVASVDVRRVVNNVLRRQDDVGWGPNATFRFPQRGGTGAIWNTLASRLPGNKVLTGQRVTGIDTSRRVVTTQAGDEFPFDSVVSTMPLDELLTRVTPDHGLDESADRFLWSSSHIVGVGVDGPTPDALSTKCWMYFPEDEIPFYRATVFSNYSQWNVSQPGQQWSLMCEVSESIHRPVDADSIAQACVTGLRRSGLLQADHEVCSLWHRRLPKGYPTPFLDRDATLDAVEPALRERGIYTRGRFGGWKYEVSNQDHSLMQGVECIDHLLEGTPELTWFDPVTVNRR